MLKEIIRYTKNRINSARVKNGIYCFNFHQIANEFIIGIHEKGIFTRTDNFVKFIKYLKSNFQIISIEDGIKINNSKLIKERYAVITFDDGDSTILDAIEICKSEAVYASFFVNSSYILRETIDPLRLSNLIIHTHSDENTINNIKKLRYILRNTQCSSEYISTKNKILSYSTNDMNEIIYSSYISEKNLFSENSLFINFGLHGHEHDRFIHLEKSAQKNSLLKNISFIKKSHRYLPIFAIPFGRPHDWNKTTIECCNELNLDYLLANTGVNNGSDIGLKRIPADNRDIIFECKYGINIENE